MGKVLQVFGNQTNWIYDLMVALIEKDHQRITKVITIHAKGNINVGTKFHGSPSNSCWDISLKTTTVNLMVALEEKSEDQENQ